MLMVTGIPAIDPQHHSHADRFIPPPIGSGTAFAAE